MKFLFQNVQIASLTTATKQIRISLHDDYVCKMFAITDFLKNRNMAHLSKHEEINPKAAHQSKNDGSAKFQFMFVLCNTAKIN